MNNCCWQLQTIDYNQLLWRAYIVWVAVLFQQSIFHSQTFSNLCWDNTSHETEANASVIIRKLKRNSASWNCVLILQIVTKESCQNYRQSSSYNSHILQQLLWISVLRNWLISAQHFSVIGECWMPGAWYHWYYKIEMFEGWKNRWKCANLSVQVINKISNVILNREIFCNPKANWRRIALYKRSFCSSVWPGIFEHFR